MARNERLTGQGLQTKQAGTGKSSCKTKDDREEGHRPEEGKVCGVVTVQLKGGTSYPNKGKSASVRDRGSTESQGVKFGKEKNNIAESPMGTLARGLGWNGYMCHLLINLRDVGTPTTAGTCKSGREIAERRKIDAEKKNGDFKRQMR